MTREQYITHLEPIVLAILTAEQNLRQSGTIGKDTALPAYCKAIATEVTRATPDSYFSPEPVELLDWHESNMDHNESD